MRANRSMDASGMCWVDPLGLVMQVLVTAADADDRDGWGGRLSAYFAGGGQRLKKLWGDSGYRGEPIRA